MSSKREISMTNRRRNQERRGLERSASRVDRMMGDAGGRKGRKERDRGVLGTRINILLDRKLQWDSNQVVSSRSMMRDTSRHRCTHPFVKPVPSCWSKSRLRS